MRVAARPSADELWLATLQRVAGRAAHEIRGALNGVSVNLEVVRYRSARPDAPAAAVATFAETAAAQLDALMSMSDALLVLARPPREPAELGATLAAFAGLLVPSARAEGVRLAMPERLEQAVTLGVEGTVARLLLGAALLAVIDERRDASCRVVLGERAAVVVDRSAGPPPELSAEIAAAAAEAGVAIETDDHSLTIAFPRQAAETHESA